MIYSAVNFSSEVSTNFNWEITPLDFCAYIISFLFGLPTHSYVLWLIVTETGTGVASEFFNLNLSVCEIGITLNSLLTVVSTYVESQYLNRLTYMLLGLMISGRPLFQCLMCVERYLAVVHPVTFLKYKPLRYRVICCTVVWIITLGCCFYCIYTINRFDYKYYMYFYSIQYLFFLSIQLFCLVSVLRALKQSGPGDRKRERKEENHLKDRAFNLLLITTVTMAVIYMPFIIAGFIFILMQKIVLYLFSFGLFCFVLAGFVQPLLYLHRAGKTPYFFST